MHGFTMRSNVSVSGAKLAAPSKRVVAQRAVAQPTRAAAIDAVTFDGAKQAGGATLELKTARAEVAKGLVHKYVVMVRQNARRVRGDRRREATRLNRKCARGEKP